MRASFALLVLVACSKVPIHGVEASFTLADASWFAEEQTLFIFYEVSAEQGLGDPSVIEVTYVTDNERVGWTAVSDLTAVHTHLSVACGVNAMCGSTSLHIPLEPREVGVRLRYHRDGDLALNSTTVFNVVGEGPPNSHRSLLVYGVFDETNQRIQWRGRHQFPTLRNQQVQALGLRREFRIDDQRFGDIPFRTNNNPYSYGGMCPDAYVPLDFPQLRTEERAIFNADALPLGASSAAGVCADATVTDALGPFTTGAVARKNPEVRAAFPLLRSPVRDATPIPFFLGPCNRVISEVHAEMQRQRLQLGDVPITCTDDWQSPFFVDQLVVAFRDAVEAERPAANDMVLTIALHQDEGGVAAAVEEALAQVVPDERHRSSPRLAGAFLLDSTSHAISTPGLSPATLWCPSSSLNPDASSRSCFAAPDQPNLELGPFTFGTLPILPSRTKYLDFIDEFSVGQAGEVTSLAFPTPEFTTTSDHVDLGEFGVVTFLNGETIDADEDDAFSFCAQDTPQPFVVRSPLMQDEALGDVLRVGCEAGAFPPDICLIPDVGLLPIEGLADWHSLFGESTYEVGLFWEFPFLLRMQYQAVVAGSVSAFGFSVPFGIGNPDQSYFGTELWLADEFPLDPALTQCRRFCDHPTFDSAGVYHITDPFRSTYARACYVPTYPRPGDSGFPLDP